MNDLYKRIATSFFVIPLTVYAVYKGGLVFTLYLVAITSLGYWEYQKILKVKSIYFVSLSYIVVILFPFFAHYDINFFLYLSSFVFLVWFVRILYDRVEAQDFWSSYLFVVLYVGCGISFSILIRQLDSGMFLLGSVLIISSLNDISAYLVGKTFGVRKAFPNVSPNKTFEGSFAGIIFSVISAVILFEYFEFNMSIIQSMFIGLLIAFLGIMGDLLESYIKRKSGIKDTGTLLPGHGGILDRVDSLIFVLPFFYLISKYLIL